MTGFFRKAKKFTNDALDRVLPWRREAIAYRRGYDKAISDAYTQVVFTTETLKVETRRAEAPFQPGSCPLRVAYEVADRKLFDGLMREADEKGKIRRRVVERPGAYPRDMRFAVVDVAIVFRDPEKSSPCDSVTFETGVEESRPA